MKRGLLILLFILISACSVSAMTVELISPSHPPPIIYQDRTTPVEVTCQATVEGDEELDNVTLVYLHNESLDYFTKGPGTPDSGEPVNFEIDNLINATYTWNCLAVSNDSVETWAPANYTFIITFTEASADNNAPSCIIAADTNKSINEDTGTDIDSDLGADGGVHCTDADTDPITYSISTQSGKGTFSVSGGNLSAYPEANATGEGFATVSVTDGTDTVYFDVNVTWDAVNDAPYLSTVIANRTWNENTNSTIDLDDYFSDVDDSSLNYSYTFTSSGTIDINVTIESDGDAVFTPSSDWTGTEKLTFTAYDSSNATATSNEVVLTVSESNGTSANTAPNIDTYLPETDPTVSLGESQAFSITKSDSDGDSMNVTWYVDNVIQAGETGNSFTYTASVKGSFAIKVAISDGQASDTTSWVLTVQSAQNGSSVTAPPGDKGLKDEVSACGDGVCAEGETSTGCCKDCGCPEGFTCNERTNKCIREKKSSNIILLVIVIGLFVAAAAGGIYFYKRRQEKEIFGLAKTPIKTPPKKDGGVFKKEEPSKKPVTAKEAVKQPLKKAKTTNQVLLKKYILYNLKKGKSFGQIKKELLKVGWTEEQINDAYTAAQLEDVFS
ncbi:MAG: hypothetical protein ISS23_01965 [Nanoarchaeota archaeon]|nr:hypothetical protein [Nanoarchaeota archaeon]